MGNKESVFTQEQLDIYQDCTYFTRKEILRLFKRFHCLNPEVVPKDMKNEEDSFKVPYEDIVRMPELQENPFKRRICEVFSECGDGSLSFDDFLDMMSMFSESAPSDLKAYYAFLIYDFDNDKYLGPYDLEQTLKCICRDELKQEEINVIVKQVLIEADVDQDGKLSYIEFEHVISRAPDFLSMFHIRL
ncbi:calcium and integrin-binding family member 2-like [Saccoglossus kowalevskii]|uniref:Calcium and integrin-binding family member 3-like n=1 Tax=Saccoglossus kowalevskii TaxID=10224 RepID=A0ABM0GIW1_SACKO|nr:PREDICTED: calcium and integrin-binding family member 3-like [Saccoglossus kowalevskii]